MPDNSIDERIPLCQRCNYNQGVKRLATRGGMLVCRDCYEDFLEGKFETEREGILPTPKEVIEGAYSPLTDGGVDLEAYILEDRRRVREACAQAAEDAVANGVIVCSAGEVANFVRGLDIG